GAWQFAGQRAPWMMACDPYSKSPRRRWPRRSGRALFRQTAARHLRQLYQAAMEEMPCITEADQVRGQRCLLLPGEHLLGGHHLVVFALDHGDRAVDAVYRYEIVVMHRRRHQE